MLATAADLDLASIITKGLSVFVAWKFSSKLEVWHTANALHKFFIMFERLSFQTDSRLAATNDRSTRVRIGWQPNKGRDTTTCPVFASTTEVWVGEEVYCPYFNTVSGMHLGTTMYSGYEGISFQSLLKLEILQCGWEGVTPKRRYSFSGL